MKALDTYIYGHMYIYKVHIIIVKVTENTPFIIYVYIHDMMVRKYCYICPVRVIYEPMYVLY